MKQILFYSTLLIILSVSSCKKTNTPAADQLPAATQLGANTFGCLVNGKVWIPKGFSGTGTPNPKTIYDIGLNALPYFQIDAQQYNETSQISSFVINVDSLISVGIYGVYTDKKQIGFGSSMFPNCGTLPADVTQFKSGYINITRYDVVNRIISGVFNFKIKPNNCDTLFFTDGRFDFKL